MRESPRLSVRVRRIYGVALVGFALLAALWGLFEAPAQWDLVNIVQWLFAVGTVGVSLVLTLKRPESRIGFIIGWLAVGLASMGTGQSLGLRAVANGDFTNAVAFFKLEGMGWAIFMVTTMVLLPLWFPTGKALSKPWGILSWLGLAVAAGAIMASALASAGCVQWDELGNCTRVESAQWGFIDPQWADDLGFLLLILAVPSIAGLTVRFRRASGVERQQLKWYVSAFVALVVGITTSVIFDLNIDLITWPIALLIPISVAVAILRYRLYDIDRIISRTVSYGLVVGLLVSVFAVGVVFVPNALPGLEDSPLLVAASTLAVAALFNPVRRRVQSVVDRRFNRSRYDAERVMEGFAGSLRDRIDSDGVVSGWVGVVSDTMQPSGVGVWVR